MFSAVTNGPSALPPCKRDQLLLQAADQREMADRLLAVADARRRRPTGPCRRATGWDRSWQRRRPCPASSDRSGRRPLDGAIDQAIEPLDRGLGEDARDQVLALLAGRHDAVEAAQRLVQALGVEALVVAADAGAVLAHRRQMLQRRQHGAA